ncbi:pentatricopeptide repeat domain-containing protein [Stagonosporopsis vannaccii]|nr:pentatricopeptide repeat domain-containing protein [Stagonosporopsis vannaccii]
MPPRPFVNDALWRCLCPGFPSTATATQLARAAAPTLHSKRNPRLSRRYNTAANTATKPTAATSSPTFFAQPHVPPPTARPPFPARAPRTPRDKVPLVHLPTHILYEDLRIAGARGSFDDVLRICKVLMQDRGQPPNKDMYAAMLHSFVSSSEGTAGKVRKVLEEMGFWSDGSDAQGGVKVDLDARGCENVLEALSVHPDYLLRAEVLEYMREKWFGLSDRAQGFVVAGLLRERLFEQALEMLDDMCAKKVRVEEWVWSEVMWSLLEFGEVEEAFYVLGLKESVLGSETAGAAYGVELSNALWGAMLDAAAKQQMHDAARIVWTTQVQPGYLKPPTGTCLNVLSLASRQGDVHLATDVFRLLTERETIFTTHHYELLIATYLKANALSDALSVILIMTDANLKVDAGTCHPLFWYLRHAPAPPPTTDADGNASPQLSMPLHAFTLLQSFEAAGRRIPTAAINTCISAAIACGSLPEALDMYKALHTVSSSGPNTATFNALFRGCAIAGRKDLAMFLANEMISLSLSPDRITYDRLIMVCERSGDLDDAVSYFEEMRGLGMRPRRGTYERLINALCDVGDERCVAVLRDHRESGDVVSGVERRVRDRFEGVDGAGTGVGV